MKPASAAPPPRLRIVETPLGPMRLHAQGGALTGAWFLDQGDCPAGDEAAASTAGARIKAKARASIVAATASSPLAAASSQPAAAPLSGSATPLPAPAAPVAATGTPRLAAGLTLDGHPEDPILDRAELELAEYFAGKRRAFSLPMAPPGTPFQRRVWDALRDIPFGELQSYGALSQCCAQSAAVRAVAQAVGRNPISIFIPCHRIVGSDGSLTGFGGGLPRKQALLALEGHAYASASADAKKRDMDPRQGSLW
ncbi:methylated-DNA--[protein]-cysteine S-methyltransferase [Bordetella bronchialis]|uniref:Methylated-DNA--protein-cysteine methyltransferase n=2 Tax=Bordetella bronchialis TaxID=463025 RepID=A0A193FT21_9BORD|nr:methylated-DNA--[protein]-cysteine S-methyltransferase [Bordetella bronchialis]ANN70209.1 hypothetical protein BAU08_01590 [Bordetella bronchialis]